VWTKRQILDGALYQLKNGCNWCDLPCILAALLDCILAFLAVALWGSLRSDDGNLTLQGAWTSQKKLKWTRLLIIDSQAVKNTCSASVQSKGFCHYKCTNGIKRHLAVDTLGLPFFTHCTLFECIRRSRLNWTVEPQSELLSRLTRQYPENYHSAWQRVSPGQAHSRIAKTLPTNYDQGQVWTRTIANQSRENSPRSIWICPGGNPMGHWALECLDGTLSRV